MLVYLYPIKTSVSDIRAATKLGSNTISEWLEFLRQLLGEAVDEQDMRIGGPGIIIKIDETKMGKRKYNRGKRVEGIWVLAGVERTTKKKCLLSTLKKETMKH